jgi:hypothetical protein
MLSDAALAIAADTDAKWLYNASRRLKRPLLRTFQAARWWRLVHHLAGRLRIQLADAARAADSLLSQGSELTRVRLRGTPDDSVGVSVDLSRFHDGAAIAIAAALHMAVPRRRGRPARPRRTTASGSQPLRRPLGDPPLRLANALASVSANTGGGSTASALHLCSALSEGGVPYVIGGAIATSYHGQGHPSESIDLIADFSSRHARSLSHVLNRLGAFPRGVPLRDAFAYDAALVRSAACLALRFEGIALNVLPGLPAIGEFTQVKEQSELVALDRLSYRVLSSEACLRSALATPSGAG